jgi:hypothetical protein
MADDLTAAWKALSGRTRTRTKEPVRPQPRGAAPQQVSVATPTTVTAAAGETPGGGDGTIASPLTEVSREYYSNGWRTTDGIFWFPAIKKVTMTDANGATVVFNYSAPT